MEEVVRGSRRHCWHYGLGGCAWSISVTMQTEGSLGTFRRLFQPWRLSDASAKFSYMFKAILWGLVGSEILWVG